MWLQSKGRTAMRGFLSCAIVPTMEAPAASALAPAHVGGCRAMGRRAAARPARLTPPFPPGVEFGWPALPGPGEVPGISPVSAFTARIVTLAWYELTCEPAPDPAGAASAWPVTRPSA